MIAPGRQRHQDLLIDSFLHLDVHLAGFVDEHGALGTRTAVPDRLRGDGVHRDAVSAGRLPALRNGSARGGRGVGPWARGRLVVAAILGDAADYATGRAVGVRVFRRAEGGGVLGRPVGREHLRRAQQFFSRCGGKAIILGRFVPIVRTFVPVVAGAFTMSYPAFAAYNVFGRILWVVVCAGAGAAFGNVPIVRDNFSLVAPTILAASLLPVLVDTWRRRRPQAWS